MTPEVAKRVIEGALLCATRPLPVADLRQLFDEENQISADTVRGLLEELRRDWHGRSVELVSLASGWRFQCAAESPGMCCDCSPNGCRDIRAR